MPLILKSSLGWFVQKLRCDSMFCVRLRIGLIMLFFIAGCGWFLNWNWEQSMQEQYSAGVKVGYSQGEQDAKTRYDMALDAVTKAQQAQFQQAERTYLREQERLNNELTEVAKRAEYWKNHKGVGGADWQCLNAEQLRELQELQGLQKQ